MKAIYSLERTDLENYFLNKGLPKYRATQVIEGLYRSKVQSFDEITN